MSTSTQLARSPSTFQLADRPEWIAGGVTLLLCFSPAARAMQLLFAPLCGALAYYLLRQSPARYASFTMFVWFLAPFYRRVADYHAGFVDPSPMLLGPLIASAVSIVPLFLKRNALFSRKSLPFSLVFLALLYGFLVGLLQLPMRAVVLDLVRWSVPVVFGAYCFALDDSARQEVVAACKQTFLVGLILMSAYAIWQSFLPAPWDLFWLANVDAGSFGSAEAVRVFGTMNSPGPFASIAGAGVVLLTSSHARLARVAQVLGLAAVILSQVRTAWIGTAVGLLYVFFRTSNATRVRMLAFAGASGAVLSIAFAISGSATQLASRASSFTNLKQDDSFGERIAGSQRALGHAFSHPFGGGMGYLDSAFVSNQDAGGSDLGSHDNGIFEFLVTLGMLGTFLYGAGVSIFVARGMAHKSIPDPEQIACLAVCLGFLAELPLGTSLSGVYGFIFWLAATMLLARTENTDPTVDVVRLSRRSGKTPSTSWRLERPSPRS